MRCETCLAAKSEGGSAELTGSQTTNDLCGKHEPAVEGLDKMLAPGRVPETMKHFLEQTDDDTP